MKITKLLLPMLPVLVLAACDRPVVVTNPPATVAVPVAVPGPPGPAGSTGATGATGYTGSTGAQGEAGKPGDSTTVIVTPKQ